MFGRKARQIANQAIMIATARAESHDHLSQIVDKNKKIIELGGALQDAERKIREQAQILSNQGRLIRELDGKVTEFTADAFRQEGDLRRQLEAAREEVKRAEGTADAAIQAGGIIGEQLHTAQADYAKQAEALKQARDAIAERDITISALNAGKQKLAQALQQAHAAVNAIADADERKPGKPGTTQSRLPRLEIQQDIARLLDEAIQTKTDTPALQALREEIAKVREGDVDVVWEMPQRIPGQHLDGGWCTPALEDPAIADEWDVDPYQMIPLPQRTPGRKLQEQGAEDAAAAAVPPGEQAQERVEDASPQS